MTARVTLEPNNVVRIKEKREQKPEVIPRQQTPNKPVEVEILGVPVTCFSSYADACEFVSSSLSNQEKTFCVAINPEKIYRAQKDSRLKKILQSANMHICDGVGASLAAKILFRRHLPRITGVDLFRRLLSTSASEGWGIYLLGASPEVNRTAFETLEEKHPDLRIVGHTDGYFENTDAVIRDINCSGADIVFVAMGSPKQEQWIFENRDRIDAPFCMGIGGTLDVISGNVKRAPQFISELGFEWLYRLVTQPTRWRRMTVLPIFGLSVFWQLISSKIFQPRMAR